MTPMDFDDFFVLKDASRRGTFHADLIGPENFDPFALTRGESGTDGLIQFKHFSGSRLLDMIGTTLHPLKIVSTRFIRTLEEGEFTGWRTYPVSVVGKTNEKIEGYHGLTVLGRCGAIDESKSRLIWKLPRVGSKVPSRMWLGLYFDLSSWDGRDVFIPEVMNGKRTGIIIASRRVKEALETARMTNVVFTSLSSYERWHMK